MSIRRLSLVLLAGVMSLAFLATSDPAGAFHTNDDKKADPGGDHEGPPVPPLFPIAPSDIICRVEALPTAGGGVHINNELSTGGVPSPTDQSAHNHFLFTSTLIDCGDDMLPHENAEGEFEVTAAGGTDGPNNTILALTDPTTTKDLHGETLNAGWSHGSCYDDENDYNPDVDPTPPGPCPFPTGAAEKFLNDLYDGTFDQSPAPLQQSTNLGEIVVTDGTNDEDEPKTSLGTTPATTTNWLKFCRGIYDVQGDPLPDCASPDGTNRSTGGGNVIAWGQITWDPPVPPAAKAAGEAQICFMANLELAPTGTKTTSNGEKVDEAALVGTARVKQQGAGAGCLPGAKKPKP